MAKVSVVIPVYNVEDYLGECLDSIINQSLKDIEIICINDGSTDNSLGILKRYAEKDDRIILLSQENQGHAVATNKGIRMATGEYLYLMDSDDIVKLNALEDTFNLCKSKNLDFIIFKAINYYEKEDKFYETEVYSMQNLLKSVGENVFTYKDIPDDVLFNMSVTPWSKLYKREFIINCGAKFPEGLIFDDNVFFWQTLFNAKRIYFLDEFLFTRRWYSSSSTTSGDQRYLDSIKIVNLIGDEFKKYGEFEHHKVKLYNEKVHMGYFRYQHIKKEYKELYFKAWKEDLIEIFNDEELFEDLFNNVKTEYKNMLYKVLLSNNVNEFENMKDIPKISFGKLKKDYEELCYGFRKNSTKQKMIIKIKRYFNLY